MSNDSLSSLDEVRPKRNVKASRQKRSPALNTRTNADREDDDSPNESGLLTPPSSQTQEDDMDPARMLFSPPPEEVLRSVRGSVSFFRLAIVAGGERASGFAPGHSLLPSVFPQARAINLARWKRILTSSSCVGFASTLRSSSGAVHSVLARRCAERLYQAETERPYPLCLPHRYRHALQRAFRKHCRYRSHSQSQAS